MALYNYDRILFVNGSDTIYNSSSEKSTLFSYLSTNGFNGMYLSDTETFINNSGEYATFATFLSQSYSRGIITKGIIIEDSVYALSIDAYNSSNGNTVPTQIDKINLYDFYWDGASHDDWNAWLNHLYSISIYINPPLTSSFYIGYYQDRENVLPTNDDVEAASNQLTYSNEVLFSSFAKGIPLYFDVNNKKSTNILNRLDILAEAASRKGTVLELYFYIHAGTIAWGSDGNYSGYSLRYDGSYDLFEEKFIKSVIDRMTSFQKRWINVKGFTYYNKTYCYEALSTGSITPPPSGSDFYRVLKQNSITTWLGITSQENTRLIYYQNHGIDWVQLYGLNSLSWNTWTTGSGTTTHLTAGRLKLFIEKAKTLYGVRKIGGIRSANTSKFAEMFNYNADPNITNANQQFDDFNIENEFWFWPYTGSHPESKPFESTVTAMQYIRDQIDNVYNKTGTWTLSAYVQNYKQSSGTAVRWVNGYATASVLCTYLDYYEATNYNSGAPSEIQLSASGSGNTGKFEQLNFIASASFELGKTQKFVPIFSAESSFSGPYIGSNGISATEAQWTSSYQSDNSFPYKSSLAHSGYNYFDWTNLSFYLV